VAKSKLRTNVYVDGFNFYYGQVKDSPYKWLNPVELFKTVLGEKTLGYAKKFITKSHTQY